MEKPGGYKTMTIDEIVTLIQAVSDNGLTSFEYEEGDQKLVLKKEKEEKYCPGSGGSCCDFPAGSSYDEPGSYAGCSSSGSCSS